MDIAARIVAALQKALVGLGIEGVTPTLEHPTELVHGDFATNVALAAAKAAKKNPKALAEEVVAALGTIDGVEKIEVAGPGFINFYLSRAFVASTIVDIAAIGKEWGKNGSLRGKKILIDHTQPNPFKPFHIGHLMSNAVGESLSRLAIFSGGDVKRVNYQGDVGLHVAKCVWGILKTSADPHDIEAVGKAYVVGASAYEDDPGAKEEIDVLNKRLYQNDESLQSIYIAGKQASLAHFDEIYSVLDSQFDRLFMESETIPGALAAIQRGVGAGVFEESEGAIIYRGETRGLNTRVFVNKLGIPTYEAKELGLIELKQKELPFDLALTATAVEQENFFKVVTRAAEELSPDLVGKYVHVPFGMMQLEGGKMSSRKGNIVTGESLIHDMRELAFKKMDGRDLGEEKGRIADAVAVSAIKFSILKQSRIKNIIFDPEAALSFEGDSGPYLQYAHTRALSILAKARAEKIQPSGAMAPESMTDLERMLYRFPEVVQRALESYEPHYVTTYLTQIAGLYNAWYATTTIVDPTDPHSPYRIALTEAFAHTMRNGLWLLGIKAPEKM
jgi:arginyl-tRNA synthetase